MRSVIRAMILGLEYIRTANNSSRVSKALGFLLSISLGRDPKSYIYMKDGRYVSLFEYSIIAVIAAT